MDFALHDIWFEAMLSTFLGILGFQNIFSSVNIFWICIILQTPAATNFAEILPLLKVVVVQCQHPFLLKWKYKRLSIYYLQRFTSGFMKACVRNPLHKAAVHDEYPGKDFCSFYLLEQPCVLLILSYDI